MLDVIMTYRTPTGDRTAKGAEAEFFREALFWTVHYVTMIEGEDEEFAIEEFDRMSYGQQLTGLLAVARAILCEEAPAPKLTSAIEACTATIFQTLREEACCEIDEDGEEGREKKNVRKAIRAAMIEQGCDEVPDLDCDDYHRWRDCIDELSKEFLFDYDYQYADLYADLPPDKAEQAFKENNISRDYFMHVLDDPPESEWPRLEKQLRDLADEGARFS
jgi:hypothetical protein